MRYFWYIFQLVCQKLIIIIPKFLFQVPRLPVTSQPLSRENMSPSPSCLVCPPSPTQPYPFSTTPSPCGAPATAASETMSFWWTTPGVWPVTSASIWSSGPPMSCKSTRRDWTSVTPRKTGPWRIAPPIWWSVNKKREKSCFTVSRFQKRAIWRFYLFLFSFTKIICIFVENDYRILRKNLDQCFVNIFDQG